MFHILHVIDRTCDFCRVFQLPVWASSMGSGVWFKNIISKKKLKGDKSQKAKVWALIQIFGLFVLIFLPYFGGGNIMTYYLTNQDIWGSFNPYFLVKYRPCSWFELSDWIHGFFTLSYDICISEIVIFFHIFEQRYSASQNKNGCNGELCLTNDDSQGNLAVEYAAATKIQTAYRAHAVCYFPFYLLLSFKFYTFHYLFCHF